MSKSGASKHQPGAVLEGKNPDPFVAQFPRAPGLELRRDSRAASPQARGAMVLSIVKYGHPVLRQRGDKIKAITPEITQLIADMFETMRDAHGIGLAAQQIGRALQLAVIDVTGVTDRPSTVEQAGAPADVATFMPLVLINPQVRPLAPPVAGPEGCLSFPEIYGDVVRPEQVEVSALNAKGEKFTFRCGGLLARAVQHETDHLNGVLFIDRMPAEAKAKLRSEVDELHAQTKRELGKLRK
jgi:peptide deformylase